MRSTLLSFLDDCVTRGEQTAVAHWRGLRLVQWSYAQLALCAFQVARELEARGVIHGDRVLISGQNTPEWIAVFYGCLLRGAVVVPLDAESAPDFCARIQQQVSARLAFTDEPLPTLDIPHISLSNLKALVGVHSDKPYAATGIADDDLVQIVFTSGTTAEPKGVCLTHRNLLANLTPIEDEFRKYEKWERLVHPLRFLCLVPLSHVFGQMMGIFVPQLIGAEVYFRESYKSSEIIDVVRSQHINSIVTVPRILENLRDKLTHEQDDGNSLAKKLSAAESRHFLRNWWTFRSIHHRFGWRFWAFITGGATLEADTETFWRRLGFAVIQGYGMTETASVSSLSHPFRIARGSIGKPVSGQELKLNDNGEILIRGNNVSPGYWGKGIRPIADNEGWIHTGDIGEVGPHGEIYFRGRSKDTIVTSAGLKIFPADLEAALDREPEIKASAVIPAPGSNGTEAMAVLIPRSDESNLQIAVTHANQSLADFQRIRHWVTWPQADFPRTTATQKVKKRVVAETVEKIVKPAQLNKVDTIPASEIAPLLSGIAGTATEQLTPSAKLADDLKLDSLGRVELLTALEDHYQIELDEGAITGATTIGEVEQIVRQERSEAVPYPFPEWAMHFPTTWIRPVVYHLLLLPITLIMCSVRVLGKNNLGGVNGPVLFIANHITDVDAALILSALPIRWRFRLAIAMAGEILRDWRNPPTGTGLLSRLRMKLAYALGAALFNVFPLPRHSGFRRSFTYAGRAMDHGWSILIFPEGYESKDGQLQPFMIGTGLLATQLNVPVVPIKISGLFEVKQRRQFFVRPGTVTVSFGPPLEFPPELTPEQITRELESRLQQL